MPPKSRKRKGISGGSTAGKSKAKSKSIPLSPSKASIIASMSYQELIAAQSEKGDRLVEIEGNVSALQNQQEADHDDLVNVQILPQCDKQKHDTHWDFLMKEMMWLSADFISERSRQMGKAKKMSVSVRQYHKHKESRLARQAAEAHTKRVKLAAKIARDVKGWWNKLDRIVAYKQRVEMDQMKQKRVDKNLVFLVRMFLYLTCMRL